MMYFRIDEFIYSKTALDKGIDNSPTPTATENIEELVRNVCDPARALLGKPITISSGYRCKALNDIVSKAPNSQHTLGEAADMKCYDNKYLFHLIKDNLEFDQLIGEDIQPDGNFKWVHCSYRKGRNRREVLIAKKVNGKMVYSKYK